MASVDEAGFSRDGLPCGLAVVTMHDGVARIDEHQGGGIHVDVGLSVVFGEQIQTVESAFGVDNGVIGHLEVGFEPSHGVFGHEVEAVLSRVEVDHPVEFFLIGYGVGGRVL